MDPNIIPSISLVIALEIALDDFWGTVESTSVVAEANADVFETDALGIWGTAIEVVGVAVATAAAAVFVLPAAWDIEYDIHDSTSGCILIWVSLLETF